MAAVVHSIAKAVTIPADGSFPFWETACGKRLDSEALGITSNKADVTCLKCQRGSKR
jgi:hypothetical protein